MNKPLRMRGTKTMKQHAYDEARQIKLLHEKSLNAIELRKVGMNYAQIADKLGYSSTTAAHQAVDRGIKDLLIGAGAEDVINLELARLDEMTMMCFQIFRDVKANYDQKLRAMDRLLGVMDRRAKYLGLDAPEKVDLHVSGEMEQVHTVVIDGERPVRTGACRGEAGRDRGGQTERRRPGPSRGAVQGGY